jgi:hypothetical protein
MGMLLACEGEDWDWTESWTSDSRIMLLNVCTPNLTKSLTHTSLITPYSTLTPIPLHLLKGLPINRHAQIQHSKQLHQLPIVNLLSNLKPLLKTLKLHLPIPNNHKPILPIRNCPLPNIARLIKKNGQMLFAIARGVLLFAEHDLEEVEVLAGSGKELEGFCCFLGWLCRCRSRKRKAWIISSPSGESVRRSVLNPLSLKLFVHCRVSGSEIAEPDGFAGAVSESETCDSVVGCSVGSFGRGGVGWRSGLDGRAAWTGAPSDDDCVFVVVAGFERVVARFIISSCRLGFVLRHGSGTWSAAWSNNDVVVVAGFESVVGRFVVSLCRLGFVWRYDSGG